MTRAWPVLVVGALAAPLMGWLAHLAPQYPKTGLPVYPPQLGVDLYPAGFMWLICFAVIAVLIGQTDRWLGVSVAVIALTVFWRGAFRDPTHSILFACGALGLWAMRQTPRAWLPMVGDLIALSGAFQAVYVLHQSWLHYDLLWGPLFGGTLKDPDWIMPIGTLGTVDGAGAYIAISAAFFPVWALPLAGVAVWSTHSLGALVALTVCLVIRFRSSRLTWIAAPLAITGGIVYRLMDLPGHTSGLHSLTARLAIWKLGLIRAALSDPVLGWGLGGWMAQVPAAQVKFNVWPTGEMWAQAHSEPVQWICETGAVGLILLGLWCYTHRAIFWKAGAWSAATAAFAADSLVFFPAHVVALALLGIVVVACAQTSLEPLAASGG